MQITAGKIKRCVKQPIETNIKSALIIEELKYIIFDDYNTNSQEKITKLTAGYEPYKSKVDTKRTVNCRAINAKKNAICD